MMKETKQKAALKTMNQEQKEKIAVSYLVQYFETDSRFQTDFPTNDKAPGYDGVLNIYDINQGDQRRKNKIDCVFNTQIKATGKKIQPNRTNKKVKFKIEKDDLVFYEKTYGNCLFFYVSLKESKGKIMYQPYYHFFSRHDIEYEKKEMKGKKSKQVYFSPLPEDIDAFQIILKNFKQDLSQHQIDRRVYETIKQNGEAIEVSRKLIIGENQSIKDLFGEEFIVYANYHFQQVPFGKLRLTEEMFIEDFKLTFKFGDLDPVTIHSDSGLKRITEGLEISKSLKLKIWEEESKKIKVKLLYDINKNESMETLDYTLKILETVISDKGFFINNEFLKIPIYKDKNIVELKKFIDTHHKLFKAMLTFNINVNEIVKNVNEDEAIQLIQLFDIKNKIVENNEEKLLHLTFGTSVYYFLVGKDFVYNIFEENFDGRLSLQVSFGNKTFVEVPPFLLAEQNISKIYNFNFDKVLKETKKVMEIEGYSDLINQYELSLLKDYDKSGHKNTLNLVKKINKILMEKNPNNIVEKINYWQIKARTESGLILADLKELDTIIVSKDSAEEINFAAKILINTKVNEFNLEEEFKKMKEETRLEFKNYPIFNLWKLM